MNTLVALPIAAAIPTVAPAIPTDLSDDRLVEAAEGVFASEAAIDQLYREHNATGADGEVDERADCRALFAAQKQHIATLISVPAISAVGIRAKASVVRAKFMVERYNQHQPIAISLADDVIDVDQGPTGRPARDQVSLSEALALVERCSQGDRRWGVLYDQIERAENSARSEHGRRPTPLIAWRDYSAIMGGEIEDARDRFIAAGVDEKVIQAEYRAAKKRARAALRAGEDWDRKVGLSDLRQEHEVTKAETLAAWHALGKVRVTSIRDAAAIIGVLRERMGTYEELTDEWEIAAFMNASGFLSRAVI
jgi:hypothetical protein